MIKFTYEDILNRLIDNLQRRNDNTGLLFYSTNRKILEAIAEELAEEMRFNEYLTRESKWSLAQNTTSIMNQTDFFNYRPHRQIGATGNVIVSASEDFSGSYSKNITIPKFTQFSTDDDIVFTSSEAKTLLSTENSVEVPVVQGKYKISTFDITTAYTEAELEFLTLEEENENIENTLYEVRVNGILWTKIDSLSISSSRSAQVYILKTNKDFSGVTLLFGDNIKSKKLSFGDVVTFHYIETSGTSGEVLQTNVVNTIDDSLTDSSGSSITLYVKNSEQIIGAKDNEDIDSIRENAPRSLSLTSRVITTSDYSNYLLTSGIVDKLVVWGETEQNIDSNSPLGTFIPVSENLMTISALSYSDSLVAIAATSSQQLEIREKLAEVKGLTDIVQFEDPKITFLRFEVIAYYDNNIYTSIVVKEEVENALSEEYDISNIDFKQSLYFSKYYELINNLESVDHHVTDIVMIQYLDSIDEIPTNSGNYYFYLETLHKNLFTESVSIYVKNINSSLDNSHPHADWYKVATDNGTGDFIGTTIPVGDGIPNQGDTYKIVFENAASELRYDYGSVSDINGDIYRIYIDNGMILDSTDYQVKFEFKAGSASERVDVIPTERQQIFAFESSDILTDII